MVNNRAQRNFSGVMEMFIVLTVAIVTQMCLCIKTDLTDLKYVQFIVCQLYLKKLFPKLLLLDNAEKD